MLKPKVGYITLYNDNLKPLSGEGNVNGESLLLCGRAHQLLKLGKQPVQMNSLIMYGKHVKQSFC